MADSPGPQDRVVLNALSHDTGRYLLDPILFQMLIILLPVFVYGIIRVFSHGFVLRSGLLLLGPIVSLVTVVLYPQTMYFGRSVVGALCDFRGFLPYFFGLYLVLVEGIGRLISLFAGFSLATLFAGIFWVFIGWAFSYKLGQYTEAVQVAEQARKRVLDSISRSVVCW
jgi:hypothetical protein